MLVLTAAVAEQAGTVVGGTVTTRDDDPVTLLLAETVESTVALEGALLAPRKPSLPYSSGQFRGIFVPGAAWGNHHAAIGAWRREQALGPEAPRLRPWRRGR